MFQSSSSFRCYSDFIHDLFMIQQFNTIFFNMVLTWVEPMIRLKVEFSSCSAEHRAA